MRNLVLCALLVAGCVHPPVERCPTCTVVDAAHPQLPRFKATAERVFVIVPGVLGYGWEWDDAVRAIGAAPHADYVIFWWDPWGSVHKAARDLADTVTRALFTTPATVHEVVLVAHSMGGIIAAHALGRLHLPDGKKLTVVTIGAPFGGMLGPPFSLDDPLHSPAMMAIMGTFRDYPPPPPGARVIEYVTSWPSDPVMQPRYGHVVAPPEIGPRGARRISVDPKFDHNHLVSRIVIDYLNTGAAPENMRP
jgi:alpha-beta hydrolase superfamily lysophospholipase